MSKQNNRNCVVCGKSYRVCRSCEDAYKQGQTRWRMSCDKPECYIVLTTLTAFYYGKIDKATARAELDAALTEDMLPYDPQAKALIDRIYEDDPVIEEPIPEVMEVAEEEVVEVPMEEVVVEEFNVPVADEQDLAEEAIAEEESTYIPIEEETIDDVEEVITEPIDEIDKIYDDLM